MHTDFHDLEKWKTAAKGRGFKVRKCTASKHNTYWQTFNGSTIVGHFNDWKAENPLGQSPAGQIKVCN